jgi:hypothetical protein
VNIVAAEPDLSNFFCDIGNASFFEGRVRKDGDRNCFERRPSPLMGEGLGGGAGAAAKSAAEKHTQAKGAGFLPMLHARSAFVNGPGLRDLHVGSCDWVGITPTQPSPIKGEGFRYPREGCVISFRRHDTSTRIALYRADGAMAGESKVDGSSSASLLAGCFSLFSFAVPGCYLPPAPVKKRGFLRPRPASWLYFCGIYGIRAQWDQDLRASGAPAAPLAPSCRLAPVREGGGFL